MKRTKITCDHCERDITEGGSSLEFRLVLSQERLANHTGYESAVMVYPPLKHTMHFCNKACLADWIKS